MLWWFSRILMAHLQHGRVSFWHHFFCGRQWLCCAANGVCGLPQDRSEIASCTCAKVVRGPHVSGTLRISGVTGKLVHPFPRRAWPNPGSAPPYPLNLNHLLVNQGQRSYDGRRRRYQHGVSIVPLDLLLHEQRCYNPDWTSSMREDSSRNAFGSPA